MNRGPLFAPNYRGQFSGHETFPLRQLWLRKAFDAVSGKGGADRSLFSDAESITKFGVGKNMASSMRHWALACDVIMENGEKFVPGAIGEFLFRDERDPYMESPATIWLMHWLLAGNPTPNRTTTWFFAFNNFPFHRFDRNMLATSLLEICEGRENWPKTSPATIKRDVECFIRSYVPQTDTKFVDDSMEPVLAELGMIQPVGSNSFQFRRGAKPNLPDGVFLFALHEFWESTARKQNTLAVENIAFESGSPGRTFKLDEFSLTERLSRIGDSSDGRYRWSESAGVRNVSRHEENIDKWEMLDSAYSRSSGRRAA